MVDNKRTFFETEIYPEPYFKKPSSSSWGMVISFSVGALGYIVTLFENNMGYGIMLLGCMGFSFAGWLDYKEMPIKGKVLGYLTLSEDLVKANTKVFKISELSSIIIEYSTHYKQKVPSTWNGYYLRSGTENSLRFVYDHKSYRYHFMIHGPYSKTKIKEVLETWSAKGIKYSEFSESSTRKAAKQWSSKAKVTNQI